MTLARGDPSMGPMRGRGQTTHRLTGAATSRLLHAIRISLAIRDDLLVPGPLGTVASVHRSAINIRRGDRMLTVALESVGGLPNGLTVDSAAALDRLGIRPGMAVLRDVSSLSVPAASVAISLPAADGWSPRLPMSPQISTWDRSTSAAHALKLAAPEVGAVGLGPLIAAMASGRSTRPNRLIERSAAALADTVEALQSGRTDRAAERASFLIGLGPGATPSGDDLLVGLCAGLHAIADPLAPQFARRVADAAAGRTTALALTFLWHAGRGEFAERVHRTAAVLLGEDVDEMRHAVREALAWGASSGADLLVGLLVGIEADAPDLPARLRAAGKPVAAAA